MIAETSGDAVVYKYVRGAGLLYTENAADEKTWYVKDAHGDTVQLTDGNGNIVWNYAYDAFGNQKETVNSGTEPYNPFRYTGEYFDAETGFIYLRARYMDPQTGRFVSEDPVGDGVNWYVYAGGNPVAFYDPSGLSILDALRERSENLSAKISQFKTTTINTIKQGIKTGLKTIDSLRNPVQRFRDDTRKGYLDDAIYLVIGAEKIGKTYHIRQDYWQSWKYVGYNKFYDVVFDLATKATGTSMLSNHIKFQHNEMQYIFWFWKGDYINLGAGAELGIYYGGGPHWLVDTSLAMPMTLSLKMGDKELINYSPEEKQWWINGFCPEKQIVQANELTATFTVTIENHEMYESVKKALLDENNYKDFQNVNVTIDDLNYTLTIEY